MLRDENIVRRADLELRCYSLGLETEIYRIGENRHIIRCKNYDGDFDNLCEHFDGSIRPAGFWIRLSETAPETYEALVPQILFSDVVDGFKGAYLTGPDIRSAITDRFPEVEIYGIESVSGSDFSITVKVAPDTPPEIMEEMERVLLEIDLGTDRVEVRAAEQGTPPRKAPGSRWAETLAVTRLSVDKSISVTGDEAAYWFENAESIYQGKLKRRDIPKVYESATACLLDASMANEVNLRNVLLLYETVYLILPLSENFENFLAEQNITRDELLKLAEMGRLIFVLNNLESRYDARFLTDAYAVSPLCILARRGINAAVAAYLVETKDRYLAHLPEIDKFAASALMAAQKVGDPMGLGFYRLLSWPLVSAVRSFRILNTTGPLGYGALGFNDLLLPSGDAVRPQPPDDLKIVLNLEVPKVLIASALNATFFPGRLLHGRGDPLVFYEDFFGDMLRIYWYDIQTVGELLNVRDRPSGMETLALFDCKKNVSPVKVAELAEAHATHDGFRRILEDLERLDDAARAKKIRAYNDLLLDLASAKPGTSKLDLLLTAGSFAPVPYFASAALSVFGLAKDGIRNTEAAQRASQLCVIEECMKRAGLPVDRQFAEDIFLLDKISRVARLR